MSLLTELRNILNDVFKEYDSVSGFQLQEIGNNTGCVSVNFTSRTNLTVVLKLDAPKFHLGCGHEIDRFPFFTPGKARRICDYLIFYERDNILYVFLCELKSTTTKGSKNQLKAGYLLAKYLVETAHRCSDVHLAQKVKYTALLFSTNNIYKNPKLDDYFSNIGEVKYSEVLCNQHYFLDSFCF